MFTISLIFPISLLILISFLFLLAKKESNWMLMETSIFECGFSSYFYSRFSFSIQYFLIGLIFLFLDLELCLLMPIFLCEPSSIKLFILIFFFLIFLLGGLLEEWMSGALDWKS